MWKESLFSLERYGRSWHLFQQNAAENYRCRVILRAGNYKWQCLSFSSWNPIFTLSFFFSSPCLLFVTACQSIFFSPFLLLPSAICWGWFAALVDVIVVVCAGEETKKVTAALAFNHVLAKKCTPAMLKDSATLSLVLEYAAFSLSGASLSWRWNITIIITMGNIDTYCQASYLGDKSPSEQHSGVWQRYFCPMLWIML